MRESTDKKVKAALKRERSRLISDLHAMNAIAELLDGKEWDVGMFEGIADLVCLTGREVSEPSTEE